MIILRSNNPASEPTDACARFGDSVGRLFLQPRYAAYRPHEVLNETTD